MWYPRWWNDIPSALSVRQQPRSEVAFTLPVECAHIAIVCPYKELAGRFCMQVQVHERARSIKESVHS